jgi:hypothetical protein
MSEITVLELSQKVIGVMQDVLIHQRGKWGPLLGHQHQYEGWWKAEFSLALESWAQSFTPPMPSKFFWVIPEAKPHWAGFDTGAQAVDLAVVPHSEEDDTWDMKATPRVWIEIKERADWWNNADKAFGGLRDDIAKWHGIGWTPEDMVIACQVLCYKGTWDGPDGGLPKKWRDGLEEVSAEYPPLLPARIVGFPVGVEGPEAVRWARLDAFIIHQSPPKKRER